MIKTKITMTIKNYYKNSKEYCMPQEFKKWAIIDGYTYYEVKE